MEERRYSSKQPNYSRVYSSIVKYGSLISEVAKEHGMTEEVFTARIKEGLEKKLFSQCIKADEKTKKHRLAEIKKQQKKKNLEDKKMASRKQATKSQQSNNSNTQVQAQAQAQAQVQKQSLSMDELLNQQNTLLGKISEIENAINDTNAVIEIHEQSLIEAEAVFEQARMVLDNCRANCDFAKEELSQQTIELENLIVELSCIEYDISVLKKQIYLVAPNYLGDVPEFGTFYSTSKIDSFQDLIFVDVDTLEYTINPNIDEMLFSGYDSLAEYMEAVRFVMLCADYTYKEKTFSILVTDERIKKLLKTHIG